ncbi:uncharacterized protein LOC116431432 isoform X2 [Nomia melanderi]|uniref:uncharacterized protein LOC116431432 isoform X2 n=1 Tax=Nomia melanderi TaxID=2448451 RepID=UPI003FCE9903
MHNSLKDENMDEECSSFCSSCNSVLQSICSIGEPYSPGEMLDRITDENHVKTPVESNGNIMRIIDATHQKTSNYTSNDNFKNKVFTTNSHNTINNPSPSKLHLNKLHKKRETIEKAIDESWYSAKKIKHIKLLDKLDFCPLDTEKNKSNETANINSGKNGSETNVNSETKTVTITNLIREKEENSKTITNSSFALDLMFPDKSQSVAQHILDRRKNIYKFAQSVLQLRNLKIRSK